MTLQKKSDVYFYQLEQHANHYVVVDEYGVQLTYAQLAEQADLYAKSIARVDKARQLVFIQAENSVPALTAYLACLRHGHVALLLSVETDEEALQSLINSYHPNYVVKVDQRGLLKSRLVSDKTINIHSDLALLMATSGSTGSPKVVRLSKQNLQTNAQSISDYLPISDNDTAITSLPLCYSYGLSVVNSHLLKGARLAVTTAKITERAFWQCISDAQVTSLAAVPFAYGALEKIRFNPLKYPALKYMTQAGGKLNEQQRDYVATLINQYSLPVYTMYGQTEATARMAYIKPDDFDGQHGAIGREIPGGKLSLFNQQGSLIHDDNVAGELVYQGPNVMMGYATSQVDLSKPNELTELATGDIAFRQDKQFYVTGRLNRLIKVLGVRIDLDSVESYLQTLAIKALCTGCDDRLLIAIESDISNIAPDDIKQTLLKKLSVNAAYIKFETVSQLPQLGNGKPDYTAVKGLFDGGGDVA
jgi:long-chain acyl-CoA synthetase